MTGGYDFQREYLVRLPLPLAQLYSRAYNDKDARSRHDNAFYLCEALIKLTVAPMVSAYLDEIARGGTRVERVDRELANLALPSLGQWVGMLRELARHFGNRVDRQSHPLGHLWQQLDQKHRDLPATLRLYQRIKNGVDGHRAADQSCSLLEFFVAMVQYRNGVFGHGGPRFPTFFENEMGPLLFPAVNEILAEGLLDLLGPSGSRLVYVTEIRTMNADRHEVALRELVGLAAERVAPLQFSAEQVAGLLPNRVCVLWPGRPAPLRLDPLVIYRESDLADEVLLLNRDRMKQVEYLSYTTGRGERDALMAESLADLLGRVTGQSVDGARLDELAASSRAETSATENLLEPAEAGAGRIGEYELLARIGRGGMGVVYLARQLSLGRLVALKMLPGHLAADPVALARFQREIRHLARCEHPGIVKVLDGGTLPDGRRYFAMEYVPGCTLEAVWRELSGSSQTVDATSLGASTWTKAVLTASQKQQVELGSVAATLTSFGGPTRHGPGTDRAKSAKATNLPPPSSSSDPVPSNVLVPLRATLTQVPPESKGQQEYDPGGYSRGIALIVRDAARAVHAVHERQIIHRDIKPANLMLTPDGSRVVLMDFGLAKGQTMTITRPQDGGLLGTLRYAAPEQLAAATLKIGPQADVRGLGVTCWELLTRRRLFEEAEDEAQLAQMVHDMDVPRIRTIDATLDADLEAIVCKACERRVADRIQSAGQLAEYLDLYLRGLPLAIRPPGLRETLLRWSREHKPMVATIATAMAAILLVTVVAFWLISSSRDAAVSALAEAQAATLLAQQSQEQADQRAKESAERFELALNAFGQLVFGVQDLLEERPDTQDLRKSLLQSARDGLTKLADNSESRAKADHATVWALIKLGDLNLQLGDAQQAKKLFETSLDAAQLTYNANPNDSEAQRDLRTSYTKLGMANTALGNTRDAREAHKRALQIARARAESSPNNTVAQQDLAGAYDHLGDVSVMLGEHTAAHEYYVRQFEIDKQLAESHPQDPEIRRSLSIAYNKLGDVKMALGETARAVEYYQQARDTVQELVDANPANVRAQRDLVVSSQRIGDINMMILENFEVARETYQQGVTIARQLAEADPKNAQAQRDLLVMYERLGSVNHALGDVTTAAEFYRRFSTIASRLAQADPMNSLWQSDMVVSYIKLGDLSLEAGDIILAIEYFQKCLEIARTLASADPENAQWQQFLIGAYERLGTASVRRKEITVAREYFLNCLELSQKQANIEPNNMQAQHNVSIAIDKLGRVSALLGDLVAARQYRQQNVDIRQIIARADPANTDAQVALSKAYKALGDTVFKAEEFDEACKWYEKAVEVLVSLTQPDYDDHSARSALASLYRKLAIVYDQLNDAERADEYRRKYEHITRSSASQNMEAQPGTHRNMFSS